MHIVRLACREPAAHAVCSLGRTLAWRGAAWRQVSNRCPLHACAAPATAASLVRAQPPDRRPRRCQGLLLVLLVGSAGRPALALPAPGGGVLGKLGVRDAGAWAGVRRPRQSYEVAGGAAVATLPRSGLLVAQRLTGVVRCVPPLPPTSCPRQLTGQVLHSPEAPVQHTHVSNILPAPVSCPMWLHVRGGRQVSRAAGFAGGSHACLPCLGECVWTYAPFAQCFGYALSRPSRNACTCRMQPGNRTGCRSQAGRGGAAQRSGGCRARRRRVYPAGARAAGAGVQAGPRAKVRRVSAAGERPPGRRRSRAGTCALFAGLLW